MSLRRLRERLGTGPTAADRPAPQAALTFVLNGDFLPGLRVLCYSLCRQETLLDLPVLFITEQASLLDDPLVALIADQTRVAGQEEISAFGGISSKLVDRRQKLDWIPKYTYLKWLMFDEYGYERLIFIDADIVCLQPIDDLVDLGTADLYGGPVFSRSLATGEVGPEAIDEKITAFSVNPRPQGRRLNTGVLVVNKRLLSPQFRHGLIAFAEKGNYSVEQAALRTYLASRRGMKLRLISPLFNFKADFLDRVSSPAQERLVGQIKLLHFAGAGDKPWDKPSPQTAGEKVWQRYHDEASAYEVLRGE